MMCKSCGRNIQNENANFCEYCGSSFREIDENVVKPSYGYSTGNERENVSATTPQPMPPEAINISNAKPVSFLDWLGSYMIRFIPFVGQFVFFIMLIIWSVGNNVSESKKNWARAKLIYSIVWFIIIMLFIFLILMMYRDPTFQEMLNNEMNQYNDLLNDYR